MLVFLDTEFTVFIDCELISIGLVCEGDQRELYLEVGDFDRAKCSAFTIEACCSQLEREGRAIVMRADIQNRVRVWFAELQHEATLASDSVHDRDLFADAFDGDWPENIKGWFDLRVFGGGAAFKRVVAQYHIGRPWDHALHDARDLREGWLTYQNRDGGGAT